MWYASKYGIKGGKPSAFLHQPRMQVATSYGNTPLDVDYGSFQHSFLYKSPLTFKLR